MEIIALLASVVIALLGWGCGELHDKRLNYCPMTEEKGAFSDASYALHGELSLEGILKTNSTKGLQVI